ncbi:hypothetical protein PGB90_005194 [Kerria lacca]
MRILPKIFLLIKKNEYFIKFYIKKYSTYLKHSKGNNLLDNLRFKINMELSSSVSNLSINEEKFNRLIHERSPYLLQHAKNPVNWYPWGEEALTTAKIENKLIFLSVGYSTCHWCHVMEKESFENEDIAVIMNENFVNIKVDREERPDVDKMYMMFVQLIDGSAGWPMSVFLTPDLNPVAGGTYFPPNDQYGRPGFKSVLLKIAKNWKENPDSLHDLGEQIIATLAKVSSLESSLVNKLSKNTVPGIENGNVCFQRLSRYYNEKFGGFDIAPKFPQPSNLMFLFHYYIQDINCNQNKLGLNMALNTLNKMNNGGIHDHIGQGFSRYSTDEKWHVPHFEKMLYDQAQLTVAYLTAYLITKEQSFVDVVVDILTYVNRDLSHEEGGFYSAEDADSLPNEDAKEKIEGAFYVWKFDEIKKLLQEPLKCKNNLILSDVFCYHYNVKENGNVDPYNDPHKNFIDQNVLVIFGDENKTAAEFDITVDELKYELDTARKILFNERKNRPRPHLDTKIITSWNGLMLSGFAKSGEVLNNNEYKSRAIKLAMFIKKYLWLKDSEELLHCCYVDENKKNIVQTAKPVRGFLSDYAFLIRGLLDLYEYIFDESLITWCEQLQKTQDNLFWDEKEKAYNLGCSKDHFILTKQKEAQDGAEPSGNSVAVHNLLRLSFLLGRNDYKKKSEQILSIFTDRITQYPDSLTEMMSALLVYHSPSIQIILVKNNDEQNIEQMLNVIREYYLPNRKLVLINDDSDSIFCDKLEIVKNIKANKGNCAEVYICRNQVCSLPVTKVDDLKKLLSE